jgi:hypothetical protein
LKLKAQQSIRIGLALEEGLAFRNRFERYGRESPNLFHRFFQGFVSAFNKLAVTFKLAGLFLHLLYYFRVLLLYKDKQRSALDIYGLLVGNVGVLCLREERTQAEK